MTAAVLELPTLILNSGWLPVRVSTVADAITKMFKGEAKAVDDDYAVWDFDSWTELRAKESEPVIHTATMAIKVPEIVVLTRYSQAHGRKIVFSRMNIYRRDNWTCCYCGCTPGARELTIDHIVPRSKGGKSEWTNCVLACTDCNRRKDSKSVEDAGLKMLWQPYKPTWSPRMVIKKVVNTPASWEKFVSDAYWSAKLQE